MNETCPACGAEVEPGVMHDGPRLTETELHELLRHPDAFVRAMADWTKAYRGWGWRNIAPHVATADAYEVKLNARLEALRRSGLTHSSAFVLE